MENSFKNCLNKFTKILKVIVYISFLSSTSGEAPILKIHYLGHSAFVLEFDNGITVVTDYGEPNAWVQWGWDSPINSIGDLIPDVMTYSHTHHEDHYDPNRIPAGVTHILTGTDSLNIDGLSIRPIRVCESNLNNEDNSAFLFSYKGFKFLHLGDAQVQIMNIDNLNVCSHVQSIIPDSLDLLFMTIEGQSQFIPQAETFINLFQPKRIIPMHFWSQEYRTEFLNYLTLQNDSGKNYQIFEVNGPRLDIYQTDLPQPIEVYSVIRDAYSTTYVEDFKKEEIEFSLEQNFPNPFNPKTIIKFSIPTPRLSLEGNNGEFVNLRVYDILGSLAETLLNESKTPGYYEVEFNGKDLSSGIYFYELRIGNFVDTKKMMLLK